jgi:hypothetical protein
MKQTKYDTVKERIYKGKQVRQEKRHEERTRGNSRNVFEGFRRGYVVIYRLLDFYPEPLFYGMRQTGSAETLVPYHKITTPGKNPKAFRQQSRGYLWR